LFALLWALRYCPSRNTSLRHDCRGYNDFRPKRRFICGYFPLQDWRAPMLGDTAIFPSFFVSIVQNNTAIKLSKHSNFEALINRPYESRVKKMTAASVKR